MGDTRIDLIGPRLGNDDCQDEDDWEFFSRRPLIDTRVRYPIPGEFDHLLRPLGHELVVFVAVRRISESEMRRGRGIAFIPLGDRQ